MTRAAPSSLPEPASMTFLVDRDNGGRYHWTIIGDGGETLVRSAGFESFEYLPESIPPWSGLQTSRDILL